MLKQDEALSMSMNYAEYLVSHKSKKLVLKRIVVSVVFLAIFLVATYCVCGGIINTPPLELLVIGVCGVGYFFASSLLKIEYEYVVASAQVEFSVIYGQRKRKDLLLVSLNDVERIAPVNQTNKHYIENLGCDKIYDFSSGPDSKRKYFMLANCGGKKSVIYFDAISKTLDVLKYFRSNIVEIDKDIYNM